MIFISQKKQRGFSIVESAIALAIASGFVVGMSAYYKHSDRMIKGETVSSSALNVVMNLQQVLTDDQAWTNTANKSVFSCVESSTCRADARFAVFDGLNNLYYDTTQARSGFGLTGAVCNTYPSADCPVRANVIFNIINCPSAVCFPRQINVSVTFEQSEFITIKSSGFKDFALVKNISGCPPGQFFHDPSARCVHYPVFTWDYVRWRAETVKDANKWVITDNSIKHYLKIHSDPDDIIKSITCRYVVYDVVSDTPDRSIPKGIDTTCGATYSPTNREIRYVWTGDTASNYFMNRFGHHDISASVNDINGDSIPTYGVNESDGSVRTGWTRRTMVYPVRLRP